MVAGILAIALCIVAGAAYLRLAKKHTLRLRSVDVDVFIFLNDAKIGSTGTYILNDAETAEEKGKTFLNAAMHEQGLTKLDEEADTLSSLGPNAGWRLSRRVQMDRSKPGLLMVEMRHR